MPQAACIDDCQCHAHFVGAFKCDKCQGKQSKMSRTICHNCEGQVSRSEPHSIYDSKACVGRAELGRGRCCHKAISCTIGIKAFVSHFSHFLFLSHSLSPLFSHSIINEPSTVVGKMPLAKQFVARVSLANDCLALENTVSSFALNEATYWHNNLGRVPGFYNSLILRR